MNDDQNITQSQLSHLGIGERSLVDILPFCPWLANNHAELEACA